MENFKSNVEALEKTMTDKWKLAKSILELCTEENDFEKWYKSEIQTTLMYEELGLSIPPEHLSSADMLKERIDDLKRKAFNYLRMYVNDEGDKPLEKAIEITKRYNEAIALWLKY